jgi:arylsulfatase A-like enzyme
LSIRRLLLAACASLAMSSAPALAAPHNVIIFVADGLRSKIVTSETAPALAQLRAEGVDFANSHSLYPNVTTPNASAIATGHSLGDTGDFGNTLFVGDPLPAPFGTPFAAVEDDVVLGLLNDRFGGNFLGHKSLLQAAAEKGYATASIGKLGPVGIQDVTARDGKGTIIIDDATGNVAGEGIVLSPEIKAAIAAAGLPTSAPDRGLNTYGGAYNMPGVQVANVEQETWFADVATKVLMPRFKAQGKPFVIVFWSRDPDGTQHNQGDSLNSLKPGINGPTTMKSIRNASDMLQKLRDALKAQGLDADTDIVVTADHGFATLSRDVPQSASARFAYPDVKPGFMPPGFLAIDLALGLKLPLRDATGFEIVLKEGFHPKGGSLLGADPAHADVVVASNGGSDLIYFRGKDRAATARRVADLVTALPYTGGLFVADDLAPIPGALPLSAVGLTGDARTPRPDMVVSFRSFSTDCAEPEICAVEIADSEQQHGQGVHGSFGRHNTHNFMAATGPDFKKGFVDAAPVSNADLAPTLAHILGLDLGAGGNLGRVAAEALAAGGAATPAVTPINLSSQPTAAGFRTVLKGQEAAGERYFDAAGMPGRVVGLDAN